MIAVKAGTTGGAPVIKLVTAGKGDKAYAPEDAAAVLAAVQRGMDATGLPLMRYSLYTPGLTRKDSTAHYTPGEIKKALAEPGVTLSIRTGNYGSPVLAVMLPMEQKTRARNASF